MVLVCNSHTCSVFLNDRPVVFIAIYKSTCYSSPPDLGISTYFLYAPLFCAGTGISDLSSWIIQNWDQGKKPCDLKRLGERVSLVRMWQKFPRREETPRETIGDIWGIGWEQGRRVQVTVNTFKEKWKTSDIRILETIWLNLNNIPLQEAHNDTASDIKDPKIMKRSSTVQK